VATATYLIQGHAARVPSLTPDPTRRFALSCLSLFYLLLLLLMMLLLFAFASIRRTRPPPLSHVSRSAPHRCLLFHKEYRSSSLLVSSFVVPRMDIDFFFSVSIFLLLT
jgi:uncharacterized protein (DUF58 family)